jgi:hypothetical protein
MTASVAKAGDVSFNPSAAIISAAGMTTTVDIDYTNGGGEEAIDLVVTYDDAIVTATMATATLIANCFSSTNTGVSGQATLAFACQDPIPSQALFTITFQGVVAGTSAVTFSSCSIDEDGSPCNATNGTVQVQGPTPTATPTFTNTLTPTATPTSTNTSTVAPTSTPTQTPTISPTGTTTNTPTVTPTGGQHTTGVSIRKDVPAAPQPAGSTIMVTITLENEDPQHGIDVSGVTNEFPFPGGVVSPILNCSVDVDNDGAFFLAASDGIEGSGPDFTSCSAMETLDIPCTGVSVPASDEVSANGTDADPTPLASGGFGGLPISGSTTNAVIVLCDTPTSTPTSTATPTITPTSTPTRTLTNTPGPTNTVPPIPVIPTPLSPGGLLMIGALGLALVLSLRRIAQG